MALVVFTGGARSGKSSAAQELAAVRRSEGAHVVVAVFGRPVDDEMASRIERHRADRPAEFETLEVTDGSSWVDRVPHDALLLVECLGTLVGLVMEETSDGQSVSERVDVLVEWLIRRDGDTIVVTNEVGDGVVPAYESGRLFRDVVGGANRRLVDAADRAYLVVCGRLVQLERHPTRATWPHD